MVGEMDSKAYQNFVHMDLTEHHKNAYFYSIGISEEAGEVAGIFKRMIRGDKKYIDLPFVQEEIAKELGDILWYVTSLGQKYDLSLEELFKTNFDKLEARDEKGNRLGNGSNR